MTNQGIPVPIMKPLEHTRFPMTCCNLPAEVVGNLGRLTPEAIAVQLGMFPHLSERDYDGDVLIVRCPRCLAGEHRIETDAGFVELQP